MTGLRLALAFFGFVSLGVAAGANGVIIPSQLDDYHVDKVVIGVLFFAFSAGYLSSSMANGALSARLGVRAHLTSGVLVYVGTSFLIGLRPAFPVLAALTVVSGVGCGVLDAGLNAFVSGLPGHTRWLNHMHAFFGVGALVGPLLAAGMLNAGYPWQDVYLVLGVIGLPLLAGCATILPRKVPPVPDGHRGNRLTAALRRRDVWLAAAFLCLYVGAEVTVGNWGFTFLVQTRGQGTLLAGYVVSGYWLGLAVGRFVINTSAVRIGMGPALMLYVCLAGITVTILTAWFGPGATLAVAGFGLMGFFLGPIFPTTVAVMPRLAPAALVPTAIGFLVGMSVVGGAVLPYVAGALAQGLGVGSLMPYLLVLTALLVACWSLIVRRMRPPGSPTGDPARLTSIDVHT